jgi:hypothetical protein
METPWGALDSRAGIPDGRHLAFLSTPIEGNVWLMEDF